MQVQWNIKGSLIPKLQSAQKAPKYSDAQKGKSTKELTLHPKTWNMIRIF